MNLETRKGDFISNFAMPILHPQKNLIIKNLLKARIEVRPLIAGNMANKPLWFLNYEKVILSNCELIDREGFYIPNHQDLTYKDIESITNILNSPHLNKVEL